MAHMAEEGEYFATHCWKCAAGDINGGSLGRLSEGGRDAPIKTGADTSLYARSVSHYTPRYPSSHEWASLVMEVHFTMHITCCDRR